MLITHATIDRTTIEFETISARNAWLREACPTRKPTETPGCYRLHGGGIVRVFCQTVDLYGRARKVAPKAETEAALCAIYRKWMYDNKVNLGSADEHLNDGALSNEQREWLHLFCERWEFMLASDQDPYAARVRALEAEGLTTSDAQAVVDAEDRAKPGDALAADLAANPLRCFQ